MGLRSGPRFRTTLVLRPFVITVLITVGVIAAVLVIAVISAVLAIAVIAPVLVAIAEIAVVGIRVRIPSAVRRSEWPESLIRIRPIARARIHARLSR